MYIHTRSALLLSAALIAPMLLAAPASAQAVTSDAQIVQGLQASVADVPNVSAEAARPCRRAHEVHRPA